MQNNGFVKVFAVLLTIVCVFYLSFSFVTRYHAGKAKEYAKGDSQKEAAYLDSLANEKVWLGSYTLKQCHEMEINLGLDLKGGMNVILEVSVSDVVKALANNKEDENLNKAIASARKLEVKSQEDFITIFIKEYKKLVPNARLSELFATQQLKEKITQKSSDKEVEKALREEVKLAIDNSFNVLRTRIDRFGVAQPNIQTLDKVGRIMVELPGIKEPERVRKLLQGSANLEFWETYTSAEIYPYLQAVNRKLYAMTGDTLLVDSAAQAVAATTAVTTATDSLAAVLKGKAPVATTDTKALEQARKENPLFALLQPTGGGASPVVGYANQKDTAAINKILLMKEVQEEMPRDVSLKWGVKASEMDAKKQTYELFAIKTTRGGKAPLEGDVVVSAKDDFDQHNKPSVSMSMNSDGSRRWALLTKQNIGKSIAIVLDGFVYSAPNVNNEITGGSSQITGNFTPEEAKDLANVLRSGKMPAPAKIVQEDVIGPSLGQESINAGMISFAIALVLLMVYICVMYGIVPGLVASGALIINMFFTMGILTSFQAALTLSGIAGLVLSLGIAVDANVLIYERIKEELRAGKAIKAAVADGYRNAFTAIFDSNLTSIITGVILFNFGTGPIRGFATTLIIGIALSFFTAVFLTHAFYDSYLAKGKGLKLTFTTSISKNFLANTKINFVGLRKISYIVTIVVSIICIGSFAVRGLSQGIDFTGGRNYSIQFEKAVEPEQVRSLIANKFEKASVSVIALGSTKKDVRVTTNYRINESEEHVDAEVEKLLYEAVTPLLVPGTSLAVFIDRENHTGGSIISSQKVGPSIADDITRGAIIAVILAVIAIGLYILLRFRDVSYSVGSVVALMFDAVFIVGAYSLLWGIAPFSLEIDQTFIGAILTAIGYSINDKVVIFDRVREFSRLYPKRSKTDLFNDSLNTTMSRTFNTSFSTLLVLLCIFFLGGSTIQSFSFAMILGVIIGTLSSLFTSSPIAFEIQNRAALKLEAKRVDEKK